MISPVDYIPDFLDYLKSINDDKNLDLIFLMGIKGGWEKWLQLEFANYFRKRYNTTATEITIRDMMDIDYGRADIEIILRYHQANSIERILIELKCQTSAQNYYNLVENLKSDILKLNQCKQENTYKHAIAFMHFEKELHNAYPTYTEKKLYSLNNVYDHNISLRDALYWAHLDFHNNCLQGLRFEQTASNAPYSSYKGIAALCYSV